MDYSQYYGNQSQAMGQQYDKDGTSQLLFNGNLHQRRQVQNQNNFVPDFRDDSKQTPRQDDQHQQKPHERKDEQHQDCPELDVRQQENHAQREVAENRAIGGQQQSYSSSMPRQDYNTESSISRGFVPAEQDHPAPHRSQHLYPSQTGEVVNASYTGVAYQSNQFAQQRLGHQNGESMMHQQNEQYPSHIRHHQHHDQQSAFDGSAQENPWIPEKPNIQNVDQLNSQLPQHNNTPLQVQHLALDQPGSSYLETGVLTPQQMKESPRTQQLTLQMEQHTLQSPEPVNFQNNVSLTPQQLTDQQFQEAQLRLLPFKHQAEPEEPEQPVQSWNNEQDDEWEPMEVLDDDAFVPEEGIYGNNENDEIWMKMDTSDYNSQVPIASTNTSQVVNFSMDNNEVPLALVRAKKPRAPRRIPKVSTSRQTSLENSKRRESSHQLSPAVSSSKPPKKFKERERIKEDTPKRKNNRGYAKTYRENQKKIQEKAEREHEEASDRVQELRKSNLQKEGNARFAIKLLSIVGRHLQEDEEKMYEKEKQKTMKKFDDLQKDDAGIEEAEKLKNAAEEALETATILVAAKKANASRKTRAGDDLKLKFHLHAKLIHEHDYKRELRLEHLAVILLRRTVGKCRSLLDPRFRSELRRKMGEHGILEQLPDFIEFVDSHKNLFKPETEQEDKIK